MTYGSRICSVCNASYDASAGCACQYGPEGTPRPVGDLSAEERAAVLALRDRKAAEGAKPEKIRALRLQLTVAKTKASMARAEVERVERELAELGWKP